MNPLIQLHIPTLLVTIPFYLIPHILNVDINEQFLVNLGHLRPVQDKPNGFHDNKSHSRLSSIESKVYLYTHTYPYSESSAPCCHSGSRLMGYPPSCLHTFWTMQHPQSQQQERQNFTCSFTQPLPTRGACQFSYLLSATTYFFPLDSVETGNGRSNRAI